MNQIEEYSPWNKKKKLNNFFQVYVGGDKMLHLMF